MLSDTGVVVSPDNGKTSVNCRPKRPQKQAQIVTKMTKCESHNSMLLFK